MYTPQAFGNSYEDDDDDEEEGDEVYFVEYEHGCKINRWVYRRDGYLIGQDYGHGGHPHFGFWWATTLAT